MILPSLLNGKVFGCTGPIRFVVRLTKYLMTRLGIRIATLITAFVVAIVVVRTTGGTRQNPVTTMFSEITLPNGQKQVCWHGICPGQTTIDEAKGILDAEGTFIDDNENSAYRDTCWTPHTRKEFHKICLQIAKNQISE